MIVALLPVKRLCEAKSRLAPVLDDDLRRALVLAMLGDTLALLERFPLEAAVVSADEHVLAAARDLGAMPIVEAETCRKLNRAATCGARELACRGASAVLLLAADLPFLSAEDLRLLLEPLSVPGPRVVLAPAANGGTNALGLRPPDAIPFRFGRDSAYRHARAARKAGLHLEAVDTPSLGFDLDTPEDVERLLSASRPGESLPERTGPRTAALLPALAARLAAATASPSAPGEQGLTL